MPRLRTSLLVSFALVCLPLFAVPAQAKEGIMRPQVIGGGTATTGDYPFVVRMENSVNYRGISVDPSAPGASWSGHCSGTLIASQWVLTAAHCARPSDFGGSSKRWRVGFLNHSSNQYIRVVGLAPHPSSSGWLPYYWQGSDLALLRLASAPVGIDPAPIAWSRSADQSDRVGAVLAGYGMIDEYDERAADELHWGTLELGSDSYCASLPAVGNDRINSSSQLCRKRTSSLQGEQGISCNGDSGGPIFTHKEGDPAPLLVGTVSWGATNSGFCWEPGAYDVYSRVGAAYDWISRTVGQDLQSRGLNLTRAVAATRVNALRISASNQVRIRLGISGQRGTGNVRVWAIRYFSSSRATRYSDRMITPRRFASADSRGKLVVLPTYRASWTSGRQCLMILTQTINSLGNYSPRRAEGFLVTVRRYRQGGKVKTRVGVRRAYCPGQNRLLG